mgnify:CR=1 FL=1
MAAEKLELAIMMAKSAGKLILDSYDRLEISYKSSNDLVTQADLESEQYIIGKIREKYPDHSILSEEDETKDATDSDQLWIIDPLDGTNNYSRGIPQFCVSIAFAEKGTVMAGVVYDPCREELFTAQRGKGAFLNGEKLAVSDRTRLDQSIIATGFYYDRGTMMGRTLDTVKLFFEQRICGMRRMGSAALDLCWVACGRYDGYFEYRISPWDIAAGMLLVEEAGGKCVDRNGNPRNLNREGIIATNGVLHDELVNIALWDPKPNADVYSANQS